MRATLAILFSLVGLIMCGEEDDTPPPPRPAAPPAQATVTVTATSAPVGATVTGGGRLLGSTPLTTQVPVTPVAPGAPAPVYAFQFSMPGYMPATVNASPVNGSITLMAALVPMQAQPIEPARPITPQPVGLVERPRPTAPAAHDCVGAWAGTLAQSDGSRGQGTVRITGARGSCGGFTERWGSGQRCDYRLTGCEPSGNMIRASASAPGCTSVRMRLSCDASTMRFFEDDGRVTVSSTMTRR